jgi:antitoxin VapB
MIDLSQETEALARRVADARRVTVDTAVRQALEASAHVAGVPLAPSRPRNTSAQSVAVRRERLGRIVGELAKLPVLDRRSPCEIMDDINGL